MSLIRLTALRAKAGRIQGQLWKVPRQILRPRLVAWHVWLVPHHLARDALVNPLTQARIHLQIQVAFTALASHRTTCRLATTSKCTIRRLSETADTVRR